MRQLERRRLGATGLEVTLAGFGALEIGRDWGIGDEVVRRRPDDAEAAAVLNGVLDLGIRLIDTARAYHRSEERIGAAIAHRRGEYVLATKCGEHSREPDTYYDFSYAAVRDSIALSRRLLNTDIIDILQIHFGPDPERVLDDGETLRAMREARDQGHVRLLGASPPTTLLRRCIDSGDFQVLQVACSLLDQSAVDLIARAADRGIGVLIRSGLGAGWLTGRALAVPPAQRPARVNALLELVEGDADRLHHLALAFLRGQPGISSVLIGTKSLSNLRRNLDLLSQPVDSELLARAVAVAR